jgi:hypothetical protein
VHLAGQAEKLVDAIQGNFEGKNINISSGFNKQGWVWAGARQLKIFACRGLRTIFLI